MDLTRKMDIRSGSKANLVKVVYQVAPPRPTR